MLIADDRVGFLIASIVLMHNRFFIWQLVLNVAYSELKLTEFKDGLILVFSFIMR